MCIDVRCLFLSRKRRSRHTHDVIELSDDDVQDVTRRHKRHNAVANGRSISVTISPPTRSPNENINTAAERLSEEVRVVGVKRMGASLLSQHENDRPLKRIATARATEKLLPPPPPPPTAATQREDKAVSSNSLAQPLPLPSPLTGLDASAALLKSLHEDRIKRKAQTQTQSASQQANAVKVQSTTTTRAAAVPLPAPVSFYSQFLSLSFDSSRPWGAVTDAHSSRNTESEQTSRSSPSNDDDHHMSDR